MKGLVNIIKYIYKKIKFIFNKNDEKNNSLNTISNNAIPSNDYYKEYYKKTILTRNEQSFYRKLNLLKDEYLIIPQVNLASIIEKKSNRRFQTELFRNIDFGIFDKDTFEVLLLIELNDKTHTEYSRKKRDKNVKDICENAGIKLITFYTSYPNEKTYVINRVKKEIGEFKIDEATKK